MPKVNPKKHDTVWKFLGDDASFQLDHPGQFSRMYFPLANEAGMLSNITPKLKGSIQTSHNAFLTQPVSVEDLHNSKANRNFWVLKDNKKLWSATGVAKNKASYKEKVVMEGGLLWHKLVRDNQTLGLKSEIVNFVPTTHDHVEVMIVNITNTSKKVASLQCTAAIPMYARSADNVRDHRHVTSLLHRIHRHDHGVLVTPTMTFDERGHQLNKLTYGVLGYNQDGSKPSFSIPTVEDYIGEGGSFESPKFLEEKRSKSTLNKILQGKEAMGAFQFKAKKLKPGETCAYVIVLGMVDQTSKLARWKTRFGSKTKAYAALKKNANFWVNKAKQVHFKTNDTVYDQWLLWLGLQPTFRKIFGNSFLPDFDYGRGGRGWRDLWQDSLALLLTHPGETKNMLLHNFGGVRIDGSNATIIASQGHEFIADRNQITRVWMDHGIWPWITTELYIHESGDINFLFKKVPYFRDMQFSRAANKDMAWTSKDGTKLKTKSKKVYQGTILEHILVQHLVQFFNVGPHNHIRLENADWNDGLDMAAEKGESVAFTAAYSGNLSRIASALEHLYEVNKIKKITLAKEIAILLDTKSATKPKYTSVYYRRKLLGKYFKAVQPHVSGKTIEVPIKTVIEDLLAKSKVLKQRIRQREWIKTDSGHAFFNGYYDNDAKRVEGDHPKGVRMTLTGQVFPIMFGVAEPQHIHAILRSMNRYLRDPKLGGIRLNTDFDEIQPKLGRAFSFAFGEKENGAFFNHMQVMMANALYRQGFVKEGYAILKGIYDMCVNTPTSKIYPGLPEYFNSEGRGLYHYLTGSASWYFMTLLTESFGVKGHYGQLLLEPKLVAEQFTDNKTVSIQTFFGERKIRVNYHNSKSLSHGNYRILSATLNDKPITSQLNAPDAILIKASTIKALSSSKTHSFDIHLAPKKNRTIPNTPFILDHFKLTDGSSERKQKEKLVKELPNWQQFKYKHL